MTEFPANKDYVSAVENSHDQYDRNGISDSQKDTADQCIEMKEYRDCESDPVFSVRLAAHVSKGCKSLIRPSSGKDIAKTKGVLFIATTMINARGI